MIGHRDTTKDHAATSTESREMADSIERGAPVYRGEESCRVASALARLGAADGAITEALGVSKSTLHIWRVRYAEFAEALETPPQLNDPAIYRAALRSALGYNYEIDKIINTPAGSFVRRQSLHRPPSESVLRSLLPARMPWGNKKTPKDNSGWAAALECLNKKWAAEARAEEDNKPPIEPPGEDSCRIAKTMKRLGATDDEIAAALGMGRAMFEAVRDTHEEFSDALKAGKAMLDDALERAVMRLATGYHYAVDRVFCTRAGDIVHFHAPPDKEADMWWRAP